MRLPDFIRRRLPKQYIFLPPITVRDPDGFRWPLPVESLDDFRRAGIALRHQAMYQWGPKEHPYIRIPPETHEMVRIGMAKEGSFPLDPNVRDTLAGLPVRVDYDVDDKSISVLRKPLVMTLPEPSR